VVHLAGLVVERSRQRAEVSLRERDGGVDLQQQLLNVSGSCHLHSSSWSRRCRQELDPALIGGEKFMGSRRPEVGRRPVECGGREAHQPTTRICVLVYLVAG